MVFNEMMSDLSALSIQYENKINGLYALFVSLERVNMRYIEKMKSNNNSPQNTKQQLKAQLQICKNMKQLLKNTKKYENLLTDQQKNLLTKCCDIDQLKPHSANLNELTNPFLKISPTKSAPMPDLPTKDKSTSEVNKDDPTKMSSASATTTTTKVALPQTEDIVRSQNNFSNSVTSTKLKRLHPWCKPTRTREEIKDRFTEKVSPAKQETRYTIQSTKPSKGILVSSKSATMEHSEHSEVDLDISSDAVLSDNIQMGTGLKGKENITSENKETVTEHKEVNETNGNKSIPQQKANIKYTEQEIHDPAITKKEALSRAQHEEAYPWEKDAAKNRGKDSPLSEKVRKLTKGVNKLLPTEMKSQLFQIIQYPDNIMKKIEDKIHKKGKSNYVCINCTSSPSFSEKRRHHLVRHVKIELGYCLFRCSFCDERSNDPRTLVNHYTSTHGIPSNWLESN